MKRENFVGRVKTRREKALELRITDIEYYSQAIEKGQKDLEDLNNADKTSMDTITSNESKSMILGSLKIAEAKLELAKKEKAILEKRI